MRDRIRRNLGARPRKKREPAVRCSGGMAAGLRRRCVRLLASMRIDFMKGYVLMTNRGHCGKCGRATCEGPVSTGKCFAIDPGKELAPNRFRRGAYLQLLVLLALSIATAGCGLAGSKAGEAQTTPTVSISMMQTPPSTMSVGATASVSATVNNDVANAGVDWVPTCGTPNVCGSFSPSHTDSGAATTFTAPDGVPTGNTVSVTALSATDHSKASAASVTILSTVTGVTITQFPPASYPAGGTFTVAATVAGDPSGEGVDWKAACGTVDCTTAGFTGGSHSAPGAPIAFTVPLQSVVFPNLIGSTVTLTALAHADHKFSALASFTVTATISINVTEPPPTTVLTNASASVIAVVTNDPTNSGVTWIIENCDVNPCGSWSATTSVLTTSVTSGATVTYFAPATAVKHVNIQAAATASPTTVVANFQLDVVAPISIVLTEGLLNNTIVAKASAPLVAAVSNDPASGGVDWTVTCASAGACGSFSPTHTLSGAPTTFTAPASVPTGNLVTITAASTTDPTKTASETDTVTASIPPDSLLKKGQWIMLLRGRDQNGGPYSLGGVVASDEAGNITGGNLDFEDLGSGGASNGRNLGLVPSTYSIGTDGRGQITLTGNPSTISNSINGNFGVNGSITLSVVFATKNHALLSETDAFGSATGTLDMQSAGDLAAFQTGTSGFSGTYSISLKGAETASPNPKFFVEGALSLTSSGGSNSESAYIADQSDKGAITSIGLTSNANQGFSSNSVPGPSGEISLDSIKLGLPAITKLNVWMIDAKHFVVTDSDSVFFGTPSVIVSGYLVAQPSSTGLSGTYAFAEAGESASPAFVTQVVGGFVACDPTNSTGPTGTLDVTPLGGTPVSLSGTHALCSTGSRGRSLITMSNAGTTGISKFVVYPTVDQGLFLMEIDGGATGSSGPSGAGVARQQTLTAPIAVTAFSGDYASNFLATTSLGEEAFAGQIVSNGVSALSGTADVNSFNNSTPAPFGAGTASSNAVLSGSFTAGTSGRFPLVLTIAPATGQPTPEFTTLGPACYIVDPNTCLLLGLDATAPGTGILEIQNTGL